jgi:hypothetical protein
MSSWCNIEFSGDCDNLVFETSKWPDCLMTRVMTLLAMNHEVRFDDTADSDRILSPAKSPTLASSLSPPTAPQPPHAAALFVLHAHLPIHGTSTATFVFLDPLDSPRNATDLQSPEILLQLTCPSANRLTTSILKSPDLSADRQSKISQRQTLT